MSNLGILDLTDKSLNVFNSSSPTKSKYGWPVNENTGKIDNPNKKLILNNKLLKFILQTKIFNYINQELTTIGYRTITQFKFNNYLNIPSNVNMHVGIIKIINNIKITNQNTSFNLYYLKTNSDYTTQIVTTIQIKYENDYYLVQNKLKKITNITIIKNALQQNKDGKYYARDNRGPILAHLESFEISSIIGHLTFTGQLIQNQINKIEVFYKGVDQKNFTISIKVI